MAEPASELPKELLRRIGLAWDAQKVEGFEWSRISHLRYLDVPGLRFVPNLGQQLRQKADRGGWFRWVSLPFFIVPVVVGRDVWVGSDPTDLKLLYSAGLALVIAFGGFLFWGLGPDRSVKVTEARRGLFFTPNLFTIWSTGEDGKPHIFFISREQILRFFNRGGGMGGAAGVSGASLWMEYRRLNGEIAERRVGLPAVGRADQDWLELWRTSGEPALPIPADD